MSGIDGKDAATRKNYPIVRGCLDYFPDALLYLARISQVGNEQHNPGQPMHHARGKSTDHADCVVRHLIDRGGLDTDGLRHSGKVLWRAAALLQEELEAAGEAPLARAARLPEGVMVRVADGKVLKSFCGLDPDKMPWLPRCSAPGAICPTEDPRQGPSTRRDPRFGRVPVGLERRSPDPRRKTDIY